MACGTNGNPLGELAATARWTAAERARESARCDRLFDDPLAEALAGRPGQEMADRLRRDGTFDGSGFAIRTRFYDDALVDALSVRRAARQAVSLAAGMDSRAFRLDVPDELTWYELDRPELLTLKAGVLDDLGAAPRCTQRPVGVDLATDWGDALTVAGFDPAQPAVWLIEGLVFYWAPAAVHHLLDEVTRLSAPGSEVLLDTIGRSLLDSPMMRPWWDQLVELGIPWQFGTDEPEADLFAPRGWGATASLYSEVAHSLGRWAHPIVPRGTPDVPQSFLVHARR